MEIMELYRKLLDAWEQTNIDEQEPIEEAIRAVRSQIENLSMDEIKFEREIERFRSFEDNQNKFDNILSILKIADRMDIKVNFVIDINTIDIEDLISYIGNVNRMRILEQKEYIKTKNNMICLWMYANNIKVEDNEEDYCFGNNSVTLNDIKEKIPFFTFGIY